MGIRSLGGFISPLNQPLSSWNTASGQSVQYQGMYTTQAQGQALSNSQWVVDPLNASTATHLETNNSANAKQNNTFIDSAYGAALVRTGNPTQGSISPFSNPTDAWSIYFDSSGDTYSVAGGAGLAFGAATSWTIEFFVNFYDSGTAKTLYDSRVASEVDYFPTIYRATDNTIRFFTNGADAITSSMPVTPNIWYHIAVTYSTGTATALLFINGIQQNNSAGFGGITWVNGSGRPRLGSSGAGTQILLGSMSNVRVLKGTALYTANFTPPSVPLTNITNTQLLTMQKRYVVDTSAAAQTITISGNPMLSNLSPFPNKTFSYVPTTFGASTAFNGTTSVLTLDGSSNLAFGSSNFTIEVSVYFTSVAAAQYIYDSRPSGTATGAYPTIYMTAGRVLTYFTNGADRISAAIPCAVNTWYHIVVSRTGSSTIMFINGTQQATTYTDTTVYLNGASRPLIGAAGSTSTLFLSGNVANLRVQNGTGTIAVNVPTEPLKVTATTRLLTCQGSATDNSGFNTITNTAVTPSTINPFVQPSSMGTMVFDGTGDLVQIPDAAYLELGTQNFCIEGWVQITDTAGTQSLIQKRSGTAVFPFILWSSGGTMQAFMSNTTNGDILNSASFGLIRAGTWNYFAVYRIGNSFYGALNGVITSLGTSALGMLNNTTNWCLGGNADATTDMLFGSIANLRISVGASIYTASVCPIPTRPLTVEPNTVVLINGTNAGLSDNAGTLNYETVGQAQVSTVVFNYGSGSASFDGTGDWLISRTTTRHAYYDTLYLLQSDFTIEAWVNIQSFAAVRSIISRGTATTGWTVGVSTGGLLQFIDANTAAVTGKTPINGGAWTHIAVVRSGLASNNLRMYVNGVLDFVSTTGITTNYTAQDVTYVGADRVGGTPMLGYINDLRVSKVARYLDTQFIPPRSTLPRH
jgi:hypothetical protein